MSTKLRLFPTNLLGATFLVLYYSIFSQSLHAAQANKRPVIRIDSVEALSRLFSNTQHNLSAYPNGYIVELADGEYVLTQRPLTIRQNDITVRSASGIRENVILSGNGIKDGISSIFDVSADRFSMIGLTLQDVKWHLVQVRAESDADFFLMDNCVLRDAGQQLLKVSHAKGGPYANNGIIRNSSFYYTNKLGPNFYIGGIDAHHAVDWLVDNNRFENISSPGEHIAEHAIHFWNDTRNITTTNNVIINSDRGIGYGMGNGPKQNYGGVIANNLIIHHRPQNPYADVGIILESSPNTQVLNNTIFMTSDYPNGIEYRFKLSKDIRIEGNITNKAIKSREGAQALLIDNLSGSF